MNRIHKVILLLAAAAASAVPAVSALAQTQSVDTSKPIVVRNTKPTKAKHEIFKGQVMNATATAITVRSQDNERLIRTFTFSDAVRDRMQQILDQGGYQYGDNVTIETESGSNVALRVKGRPSRPI